MLHKNRGLLNSFRKIDLKINHVIHLQTVSIPSKIHKPATLKKSEKEKNNVTLPENIFNSNTTTHIYKTNTSKKRYYPNI